MLIIELPAQEFYDSRKSMFFDTKPMTVRLEHSLISIGKWEANWEKPYFPVPGLVEGMSGATEERDYISCMIIGEVPEYVPDVLLQNYMGIIDRYINKKHTATTIHRRNPSAPSRKIITTELIYYWMVKFGIPIEFERWHINRLLTLIDVCSVKESSGGKGGNLTTQEAIEHMYHQNKARRSRAKI